jgi:Branched-chain amino acid transport system / permease component
MASEALAFALLWQFFERTLAGKAIAATAGNRLAAKLVGIDTDRMIALSFALSAALDPGPRPALRGPLWLPRTRGDRPVPVPNTIPAVQIMAPPHSMRGNSD